MMELVFILDRSGSMAGLESDTVRGFNSMLQRQRKEQGKVLVSTVLFDSGCEVIHDRVPLESVPHMTTEEYTVGGCTALLDAVGSTISHIGTIHKFARKRDVPKKTLFVITTDGKENASQIYSHKEVRAMIEQKKNKCGWEFLFLGANIDARREAKRFGIDESRATNFHNDKEGTALNYEVLSEAICDMRQGRGISKDWNVRIEEDFKKRGGEK